MPRTFIMLTIFLTGSCYATFSQDSIIPGKGLQKFNHELQLSVENGILLANSLEQSKEVVNSSYYNGLEIRYGWQKRDPNGIYNRLYRYPTIGAGWYASTFHNDDVGKPNAVFFYFNVPLTFQRTRKLTVSYTGAFGISYNFNPYDSINNPSNIFIGTYRNCYSHLGFNLEYHFAPKFIVMASAGFKHFSNGSFKKPNYGINLFPVAIGLRYKFSNYSHEEQDFPVTPFIKHNQFNVKIAAGSKNYDIGGDNYLKLTLGIYYQRQISYKYRIGLGLDAFYSAGAGFRNETDEIDYSKSFSCAVVGSWEWVLNRVVYFPIGLAYYLHRNIENDEILPYYERIGIGFRLTEHLKAGLTVKAHGSSADMLEWTIAYTFLKDPNKYR